MRLELDFPERLPYVSADIGLIERVLENLIGNALTHTAAGGAVRLALRQEGAEVVHVAIPARASRKDLPHVFERFYRVNNVDWDKGAHAGLGLAITKSILDLHGSRLKVDSTVGVGTSFAFRLPVVQLHAASAGDRQTESHAWTG